mmetsp:Transcript_1939/g.2773  ORF Transcript_1939/g.2773 Transcript_1939/m.2773 type:complete len:83 (+) Transcript_1939:211-459(+)
MRTARINSLAHGENFQLSERFEKSELFRKSRVRAQRFFCFRYSMISSIVIIRSPNLAESCFNSGVLAMLPSRFTISLRTPEG